MKTIAVFFNINNNGINQSTTSKKFYTHKEYEQAAGDVNRNATKTEVEYERDACEEELYRLRYGLENLLANNELGDYKGRQRLTNIQNPFRTMMNKTVDLHDRKNKSWMDRCSPCCRRWRRNRFNDNVNIPNSYHSRGASESPYPSQLYGDSPSPYTDPNINRTKNDLRQSISNLINPNRSDVSDLLRRKGNTDPACNSLIYKILEAKALDCLCTGYSKQNTQREITQALGEINQSRTDQNQWDSASVRSSPGRSESSSSVSSLLSNDQSLSPRSVTPQKSSSGRISPSASGTQTPNLDEATPSLISPNDSRHNTKSSLKLNETIKSPKKKSKVTIVTNGDSRSSKSKKKKRSSSKNRKDVKSRSKKPRKSPSTTRRAAGSNKKRSSSRTKPRKSSSKSPSRSRSSKKGRSSKRKTVKRKKAKSNNQITDHEGTMLQTFIYPQAYQQMYRNRQRILKLLLSST